MATLARIRPIVVGALLLACSNNDKSPSKEDPSAEPKGEIERRPTGIGDAPLANGQASLEALGKGVVAALEAKDGGALLKLSVSQWEFERRLFGALVNDVEAHKFGPGPAWKNISSESLVALGNALSKYGGKGHVFVSLESTQKEERPAIVLHRAPKLTVKDAGGNSLVLPILGEVIEHPASGTFLVLAFAD